MDRRRSILAGVCISLAAGLSAMSCGSPAPTSSPTPVPATVTLSGAVTETAGGAPLAATVVTVQGKSATTGADGRYALGGLAAGTATVTAQHQGHDTLVQTATLAGPSTTLNLAMTRAFVAQLAGNWTGGWVNTTFGSSGTVTMTIAADTIAQTFSVTLDLNGSVFGLGDPPPQTFAGPYTPTGGATIAASSPLFGTLSVAVSATGQITGSATPAPGGTITKIALTGTATPSSVIVNYTITFTGGSTAVGSMTLNKG